MRSAEFGGTGLAEYAHMAREAAASNEYSTRLGIDTWAGQLLQQVYEALAENDPARVQYLLVEVSYTVRDWVEVIGDRRRWHRLADIERTLEDRP